MSFSCICSPTAPVILIFLHCLIKGVSTVNVLEPLTLVTLFMPLITCGEFSFGGQN